MARPASRSRLFGLLLLLGCEDGNAEGAQAPEASPVPSSAPLAAARNVPLPTSAPPPKAEPPSPKPEEGLRVYAKTRFVWVFPEPDAGTQWIGFLWVGGSAKLRREKPYYGPGCSTWYAVEPRGYVCVDGTRATLDPKDPTLVQMLPYAPKVGTPFPHRYGESLGLKRHRALPGKEPALAFANLPKTIFEDRTELLPRSTVAFSEEVKSGDEAFLLSADFMWVKKDRVAPYPEVTFQGVTLDAETTLPIAWFRDSGRRLYRRVAGENGEPAFEPSGEEQPRLSSLPLGSGSERVGDDVFLETRKPGLYVRQREAVVPRLAEKTPWGADIGREDTTASKPKGRATWIDVSVLGGWLVAYEGTKPVYATLVSSGRGGVPVPGKSTLETASTPTGRFTINGKFATATMEAPNEFIHSSVPWAQNFSGPYALHAAYWHDDFGKLKSGGCINVSPVDGKWLFEFTEPKLPEGWHGVRWLPWLGPATRLIVHN